MFVEHRRPRDPSEIELRLLRPGDRIVIGTKNTRYELEWHGDGKGILTTDRADRPWGPVTVAGCAFRRSGALARDVLFSGGKMEYVSTDGQVRHRTTTITTLKVVPARDQDNQSAPVHSDAAR
jgi:hypothetical protein